MKISHHIRHISVFSAWALAFGCSVGWDAITMPWTTFLPKAGPLGTMVGLVVGGLVMTLIAWNFHYMMNRKPGPGGVYVFATEAFGYDHGYLCAWFLCLTYASIVWADAAALPIVARYMLGDGFLHFGFRYAVAGFEVCLGDILISGIAAVLIVAICVRRHVSAIVQTVLAVVFLAAFIACFAGAAARHAGGIKSMYPLFSPFSGGAFFQFLSVLTIAPWLFIGFESISVITVEFRFSTKRSFWIMVAAIVTTVAAYAIVTAIPVLAAAGSGGWTNAVAGVGEGAANYRAFDVAKRALGGAGTPVICCALLGAIFTNLIGNTMVASRLLAAMAHDGAMPAWLGGRNGELSARNAMLVIACIAVATTALGQTVISIIVDVALVGAAISYAYTSAATMKMARARGDRFSVATGFAGLVLSVVIGLLFLLPIFSSDVAVMSTESYMVLVLWSIIGLGMFLFVFRKDSLRRFGRSPVVWTSLFVMILVVSLLWGRQKAGETTQAAYDAIAGFHSDNCVRLDHGNTHQLEHDDWRASLRSNLAIVNETIIRNNYVQGGLTVFALVLMLCLYGILRRRERDIEQEKARAKSYFFSTVSHDIRTPLNAIIGFSEMLKAGFKTDAERDQAVDAILVSGRTLLGLINDVLDLSKLESGKMEISLEPTDCSRLMHDLAEAFRVSNTKHDVELRCHVGEMPLLMLDPQRLRQIVFNLVGNAFKFTAKGHVELRAFFDAADAKDGAGTFRLEVEDTGCGISDEDMKRLGSAYVQVGSKISRNGGTGLGLAICRQLAAAMGGSLNVKSRLGAGSTFSVVIHNVEVAPAGALPADPDASGPQAKSDAAEAALDPSKMPRRILIADDSKMNIMVLKALLKHVGEFDVATAADGQEALDMLTAPGAGKFDLLLTDMWMPHLDGGELVRSIRANTALASLRVVVVTADVEFQDKFAGMGFDGILLKPITTKKLAATLAEAGR